MTRPLVVGSLVVLIALAGCGGETPDSPDPTTPDTPGTVRTPDEVKALLVGTWDFGAKFQSGDVIPMVRVIEADGTGYQYAKEDGLIGKQSFTWSLGEDAKVLTLKYGETMAVECDIEKIEPGRLDMKARARFAMTEECVRRE